MREQVILEKFLYSIGLIIEITGMSIHLKKRSRLYKILEQSQLLDLLFFGFLIDDYQSLLVLDKIVHHTLIGRIASHRREFNKKFEACYAGVLALVEDKKAWEGSGRGARIKLVKTINNETKLSFPLLFRACASKTSLLESQVYNLAYSHRVRRTSHRKKNTVIQNYVWNYQFIPKGVGTGTTQQRRLWMFCYLRDKADQAVEGKNMPSTAQSTESSSSSFASSFQCWRRLKTDMTQYQTFSIDTMPISQTDTLRLNIPFFINGHSVFDLNFYPLESVSHSDKETELEDCYPWRECTKEDLNIQCLHPEEEKLAGKDHHQHQQQPESISSYSQLVQAFCKGQDKIFQVQSVKHSGVGEHYQVELRCREAGAKTTIMGVQIHTVASHEAVQVQLKKKGCYDDEGSRIWMRVGETMIVYFIGKC